MSQHEVSAGIDKVGAACSTACAVHCASSAVAPGLLTALGLGSLVGPTVEWGFTGVAIVMGLIAVIVGWRRHRVTWVLLALGAGIAGLATGRMLESFGVESAGAPVAIVSGLVLALGHVGGVRAARAARAG